MGGAWSRRNQRLASCSGGTGNDRVDDVARLDPGFEEVGDIGIDRLRRGQLDQRVVLGAGVDRLGGVGDLDDAVDRNIGQKLEGRDQTGRMDVGQLEQRPQRVEPGDRSEERSFMGRGWDQLQDRGGDDAKRSFAANKEVLEVVTGGVLHQRPPAVPHRAVGEYRLDTHDVVAHVAVTNDVVAARVGGDRAADGRGAAGAPVGGELAAGGMGGVLDCLDGDASLGGDRPAVGVDRDDLVETGNRQHDRRPVGGRVGAVAQTAVAALRNDGHAVFGAQGDGRGNTACIGGPNDNGIVGRRLVARVDQERGGLIADEDSIHVERCPQGVDEFRAGKRHQSQATCSWDGPRPPP